MGCGEGESVETVGSYSVTKKQCFAVLKCWEFLLLGLWLEGSLQAQE